MEHLQDILHKLDTLQIQVNRLVSDAESEKNVRRDRNKEIDRRLTEVERRQERWIGAIAAIGIMATIISIITFVIKIKPS